MLRIYFMQQWFNLSDPAMEDSLYDSESMRRFAGIELVEDAVPDETTILRFRHLLEKHQLTQAIFGQIRSLLEQKRLLLKSGTIVDATIIEAPPSTKNEEGARDPEMHQTKKGKDWHFGMKAHVGTDRRGIVHSLSTTAAKSPTSARCPSCCTGRSARCSATRPTGASRTAIGRPGAGIRYRINRRGNPSRPLSRVSALHQPPALGRPGARRTCLPRGEAPVGLYQGALSRPGEEHRAALHRLCAGEPVPAQTTIAATAVDVCLVNAMSSRKRENFGVNPPPVLLSRTFP